MPGAVVYWMSRLRGRGEVTADTARWQWQEQERFTTWLVTGAADVNGN